MRFHSGRVVTAFILAVLLLMLVGADLRIPNAYATTGLIYPVSKTTAAGGVYARYGPHTDATTRTDGYGVYPDEQVQLLCGVTDGDPIGPYANTTWHFVTDMNNPGEGNFWLNDHYIDSPNVAGQLAPGESRCLDESSNPLQNGSSNQVSHLPCTPLLVIGVRGSGHDYQKDANGLWGLDGTLSPLVQKLINYYGKDNVTPYGLPFPADSVDIPKHLDNLVFDGGYKLSVTYGVEALNATVTSQAGACQFQLIDLVGYSQGADVVNNTIPQLPQSVRDHINGVVTFGDPQFNPQNVEDQGAFDHSFSGVEGVRPELPGDILQRARSYCVDIDMICNYSSKSINAGNKGHDEYTASYGPDAVQFLESLGFVNSAGF